MIVICMFEVGGVNDGGASSVDDGGGGVYDGDCTGGGVPVYGGGTVSMGVDTLEPPHV